MVSIRHAVEKWINGLAGSIGAGGSFLESRGKLVYAGSFGLTCPGEFSRDTLRLYERQLKSLMSARNSAHRKLVVRCLGGAFTIGEATPRFMALMNNFSGVFLVLGLAGESKLILGLAIRDFVDTARDS
jgi:hypothetical protein